MYGIFFNKLFRLEPKIQSKLDWYLKKAKPNPDTSMICIQVRIGGARPNVGYDREITPRNFSVFYWQHVREKFLSQINNSRYHVFVTADTESVEREAMKEFGTDKVTVIGGISSHVDREYDMREDCTRYEKIVLDYWMLGFCDMALVSDSGFGILGVLRAGIPKKNFYVLSALENGLKEANFFKLEDFIWTHSFRY